VSYQVAAYNPPPSILAADVRDFRSFRDRVKAIFDVQNNYNQQFFQNLVQAINNNAQNYGANIAAAATIHPTTFMHLVTGTATITTIVPPAGFNGQLALIAQAGFSTATGGNISRAVTVAAGQFLMLVYLPPTSTWYTHL
jgi:hypothetical protein